MAREIFISYSRNDKDLVLPFVKQISKAVGKDCWIDMKGIEGREEFEEVIMKAIDECQIVLFMLSDSSLKSPWTKREVYYAEEEGKRIVPVIVDGNGLRGWSKIFFSDVQHVDIRSEKQKQKLIGNLRDWLGVEEAKRKAEEEAKRKAEEKAKRKAEEEDKRKAEEIKDYKKGFSYVPSNLEYKFISYNCIRKSYSYASLWDKLFDRKTYKVYSSIFAPAEIKHSSHMLVQVYLHLPEETEMVNNLAQESQKDAERRDYIPLQCKLKENEKVKISLNIYGEKLLMSETRSVIWQGSFTECSFGYYVPKDIEMDELSCVALLTVNNIPVGEMRFITKIVEQPRPLHTEIIAHLYSKVFISYSHKDKARVKPFHEGLKLAGIDHFFDRAYLKAGDIFPQVIQDYINSADLFVLFWSKNASKSEYVEKEYTLALERAFPKVPSQSATKLRIYPMSIEPHAELPSEMKDNYHFGEM